MSFPVLPWTIPAFTRFHFALRFWNQILTWTSLSFKLCAMWDLSVSERYFLLWNSFSSSSNCSLVKAVLRRLDFTFAESLPFPVLCIDLSSVDVSLTSSQSISVSLSSQEVSLISQSESLWVLNLLLLPLPVIIKWCISSISFYYNVKRLYLEFSELQIYF